MQEHERKAGQEGGTLKRASTGPHVKAKVEEPTIAAAFLSPAARRTDAWLRKGALYHPANSAPRAEILAGLQHSRGNAYVQRLLDSLGVQAKLTVSSPGDELEKAADRMAENLVGGSAAEIGRQEQEEEEAIQAQRLYRQAEEQEEEAIQAKSAANSAPEVTEDLERRIDAKRGSGESLPDGIRREFEPRIGRDFGAVRIHTGVEANRLTRALEARAFTTGRDIFFRQGEYQPGSDQGRRLLGHEIAHVVQQGYAPERSRGDEKTIRC